MTLRPSEGVPLVLILALLAALTFLAGFYYGRESRRCVEVHTFDALMRDAIFKDL